MPGIALLKNGRNYMDSKEYIKLQFSKLVHTKWGYSIKIFDGNGNVTNQMELTPNRAKEILKIIEERNVANICG